MIKGVHIISKKRPGKPTNWYVYAWRGGPCVHKVAGASRPRLDREVVAKIHLALEGKYRVDPATLLSLIRKWRSENPDRPSSPEWARLAPGTKKTWGAALDLIEERWGKTPISIWNDARMIAKVVEWRDSRASTPRSADIGITVLRALLAYGRLQGMVAINVAENIPTLYRNGQRADIVWTEEEISRFAEAARAMKADYVLDGLRLAALTGLRRQDLVTVTWAHVGEFAIVKKALKQSAGKRQTATMPRIPALDALLADLRQRHRKPGVETLLINSYGEPWTGDGLSHAFNRIRDAAKVVHVDSDTGKVSKKHLHDVRGTFCTRLLVEGGLSDQEAAGIMGWAVDRVASIRRMYVDQGTVVRALGEKLRGLGR
jgi:integrase